MPALVWNRKLGPELPRASKFSQQDQFGHYASDRPAHFPWVSLLLRFNYAGYHTMYTLGGVARDLAYRIAHGDAWRWSEIGRFSPAYGKVSARSDRTHAELVEAVVRRLGHGARGPGVDQGRDRRRAGGETARVVRPRSSRVRYARLIGTAATIEHIDT